MTVTREQIACAICCPGGQCGSPSTRRRLPCAMPLYMDEAAAVEALYAAEITHLTAERDHYAQQVMEAVKPRHDIIAEYKRDLDRVEHRALNAERERDALLAEIAAEREACARLVWAAEAFDKDLSDYCDGEPRDELRAAIAAIRARKGES